MGEGPKRFRAARCSGVSIPFVISKSISRKPAVPREHDRVAGDLGDDGGGRDMRAFGIAFDNGRLKGRTPGNSEPVDQYVLRLNDQEAERHAHGGQIPPGEY